MPAGPQARTSKVSRPMPTTPRLTTPRLTAPRLTAEEREFLSRTAKSRMDQAARDWVQGAPAETPADSRAKSPKPASQRAPTRLKAAS